ncbi:MAG: class I SAM-dependent methyltransferase [Bacteroidales bacterium]|nr:class I SAM-dependent methyltransferase [Bacteroidales bacterium]
MHCRICNNTIFKQILTLPDIRYRTSKKYFDIVKCEHCGVFITCEDTHIVNSEPYYSSDYGPFIEEKHKSKSQQGKQTVTKKISRKFQPGRKSIFLYKYTQIALSRLSWMQQVTIRPESKILDVGCGTGIIGSHLADFAEVVGIEPNASAAQLARDKGLQVVTGTLNDFNSQEQFDLVLLSHVLEHLPDPLADIQHIHQILKPKGKLIIAVPNVNALERKIFNKYWDGWDVPRHIHHFNPKSLRFLLRKAGFEPGQIYYEQYSLFARSFANWLFKNLPYHKRKGKCKFNLFEKTWSIIQPLLKSSSAIQVVAERI